ncbi:hypothetical protein BDV37DRAFT_293060 [Aspergillus pseudonomiae]|uniref:DUF6536 domain-containing protein n=1 Tax=Aspergillus pseudonomiae TaxID=1506151 RepID=A0A5N7DJ91_9EURO|nr:uncharacterized protein BDV37DRAFT_293060 [Aspergillus pseudonomiae]KAE8405608.1 hypothetical protein BDV37DRAFT_293060 [Aspergillus pseudonomiae]
MAGFSLELSLPSSWRPQPRFSSLSRSVSEREVKDGGTSSLITAVSTTSLTLPGAPRRDYQEGEEWIKGALLCTWGAGIVLALNFVMAIVATGISYSKPSNKRRFQSIALYDGDCSVSSHWATGLHLLINLLSTLLLAASNYVMQCLGAPSRSDVDQAHKQRKWLDIGTFSVRNFAVMDTRRKILWTLLLLSSTPIHMIYNSVVFSSISMLEYATVLVPEDLTSSEPLVEGKDDTNSFIRQVGTSPVDLQAEISNGTFQTMSVKECINRYNVEFNTQLGTLIFTTDRNHFHNTGSLHGVIGYSVSLDITIYDELGATDAQAINDSSVTVHGLHWTYLPWNFTAPDTLPGKRTSFTLHDMDYLYDYDGYKNDILEHDLDTLHVYLATYNPDRQALSTYLKTPTHWANSSWAANLAFELDRATRVSLSRCMTKDKDQRCQLFFSPPIAIAVIVSNVIKVVCMYLTARTGRKNILLTVGDALASFLTTPDPTTEGKCLLSRADVSRGQESWTTVTIWSNPNRFKGYYLERSKGSTADIPLVETSSEADPPADYPKRLPERKRWYQAASVKRWTATLSFFTCCLATSIFLLWLALGTANGSIPEAWALGFGKATGQTMIPSTSISSTIISLVLLSNTPQIVLSILYFLCNGLMTCMRIAAEYDDYATQRKPLRVSWPRGEQRSTYYLSLPYRYSAPLIFFSAVMHWLLSQSIFFVHIQVYDVHDQLSPTSFRGCGYSPIAIFIVLLVSSVALLALLGVSSRRLKSRMPLATHCSAAISAACHPPPGDRDAALKPVMWGEVPRAAYHGAGPESLETRYHCTFTSQEVETPNPSRLYL